MNLNNRIHCFDMVDGSFHGSLAPIKATNVEQLASFTLFTLTLFDAIRIPSFRQANAANCSIGCLGLGGYSGNTGTGSTATTKFAFSCPTMFMVRFGPER